VNNPVLIEWLRKIGPQRRWVTSVCTGALLLCEAGFARGKRVTTHWAFVRSCASATRRHGARPSALCARRGPLHRGRVSAGIDLALWLTGQLWGVDAARLTQRNMEYDPAPPYAAEVG